MYLYDHLVAPPSNTDGLTMEKIIWQFLRGDLAPETELTGPAGTTNVWDEILRTKPANHRRLDREPLRRHRSSANMVRH